MWDLYFVFASDPLIPVEEYSQVLKNHKKDVYKIPEFLCIKIIEIIIYKSFDFAVNRNEINRK